MARAADRYRVPAEAKAYYSLRIRASTAGLVFRTAGLAGALPSDTWDQRLGMLCRALNAQLLKKVRRG